MRIKDRTVKLKGKVEVMELKINQKTKKMTLNEVG